MSAIARPRSVFRAVTAALLICVLLPTPVAAADDQAVYTLQADGLACPFCAYGIEKQLIRIEGVDAVETDLRGGTVVITMKPGAALDEVDAKRAVEAAGFTMREFRKEGGTR